MKSYSLGRALMWSTGIALLGFASAADAATGVRVLLQAWNPATPDQDNVVTLLDDPALASRFALTVWRELRPKLCDGIKSRLGVGGLAGGQTLYDIECILDNRAGMTIRSGGQNTLVATFTAGGYIEATSTTPTVFDSYTDPRFSVSMTGKVDATIAIQPGRDETLRATQVRLTINSASLDSHNLSGDILEFVVDDLVPFFGGDNYKREAEQGVNAISLELSGYINKELPPINEVLKGPSDTVRVGVSGAGGYITAAFAPREFTPTTTGIMKGILRWDGSAFAPRNACQSFDIRATVQTGPVPMFVANAEAPRRQLGVFEAEPWGATACSFTLSGLAAGWPNFLTARVVDRGAARGPGAALYKVRFSLAADGWDGRVVVPKLVVAGRNYVVARAIEASAVEQSDFSSMKARVATKANPIINPADRIRDGTRLGDTVSLNPQPLPPGPDRDALQRARQNPGAQSGIIIVSGQPDPFARKSQAGKVFDTRVIVPGTTRAQSAPVDVAQFETLAAKGPQIARQDPLADSLRNGQAAGPTRVGFDIGMAVAEGHTLPGPGKQQIFESLRDAPAYGPYAQQGFATAVAFSLQRNAHAKEATAGAAIADMDDTVAAARNAETDAFYRLGFDIASGIFGDPALGAWGNTGKGPGSLGIRKTLSPAGQRGFDDSAAFHLSRKYPR